MKDSAWYRGNLANLLCMACHMSVTLLPLYLKRQGFTNSEIGWLGAGFSLAAILVRAKLGDWMQEWGRRPFLYLGSLLLGVVPGVYVFLGTAFAPWLLVRVVQGAGLAFYITTILTWVADRSPPDRIAQGQGVFGVSGLLGSALGPMLFEAVYQTYGFPVMFKTIGVTGLLAVILAASLPESRPEPEGGVHRRAEPLEIFEHRATLCVTVPFGWLVGTVINFIAPYCDSVGLRQVGIYFVGFALASVTVRLVSGSFIDRVRMTHLVWVSGGLLALSGLALAALGGYPYLAVLFSAAILNGVGHGFLFPGLSAHTMRKTTPWQRGAGMSLYTGVFDSGVLLGSVASGYISQEFGYSSAFLLAGLLLLISLPLFAEFNSDDALVDPRLLHVDQDLQ